jgi:outer membrane receptor for ferrienterochelin and colicin
VNLAVDYTDIQVDDEIAQIGGINILNLCYTSSDFRGGNGFCNLVAPRDPGSKQLTVLNGYVNISQQVVRGIDYNLRYVVPVGPGSLRIDTLLTQYLEQSTATFEGQPRADANATLETPKYTGTFEAAYSWQPWKFRYELDWVSSQHAQATRDYWLNNFGITFPNTFILGTPDYYLHNIAVQYSPPKGNWQVTGGVRNLLDKDPPSISATGRTAYPRVGNAPLFSAYDFIGRTVYVNFTKKLF